MPKMYILITSFLILFLMLILRSWFLFKKYTLITGFIIFLTLTMRIWFFKVVTVHPMLKIYILITRFLNFRLMLINECTYLSPSKRAKFSDMLPGERMKEYLRLF